MIPRSVLLLTLVGFPVLSQALEFATYPYRSQPRQQTEVRENNGVIRTIYDDVSSPMMLTMPGKMLNSRAQLDLGYHQEGLYREDLADPAARDEGAQHAVDLRVRTQIYKRLSAEVRTALIFAQSNDEPDLATLDVTSVIALYQDRYRGASLAFGVGVPIGSGHAFGEGHQGDYSELAYFAQMRFTESIGFNVIHWNVGIRYRQSGNAVMDHERITKDGDVIPTGEWGHSQLQGMASLGYSFRPSRWFRLGMEGMARWDRYDGDDGASLTDRRFQTIGFLEVNPNRNMAFRMAAGVDPDLVNKDDADSLIIHGSMLVRF